MSFFDEVGSFVYGLASALTGQEQPSSPTRVPLQPETVFRYWMKQLASYYGADVHWDETGDTGIVFGLNFQGKYRAFLVLLRNGELHVSAPSCIKFASGGLPREIATVLAARNNSQNYGAWDFVDNGHESYFTFKGRVRMDQTNPTVLKGDIDRMLTESYAVDETLLEHGYAN